jgi:molybdopterin-guanine dinucleotide biosynthesis protein A
MGILGVILAGGLSRRMGTEKALLPIGGMPLLAHVANRFRPQVEVLVVNANGDPARFAALGFAVLGDEGAEKPDTAGAGPLAGIAAALAFARGERFRHLATVPVDAPLLPLDLVARLADGNNKAQVAVAGQAGSMEPLFALWPAEFAPDVAAILAAGERAVHRVIERLPHRIVDFSIESGAPSPFLNLNTPADVAYFDRNTSRSPSTR